MVRPNRPRLSLPRLGRGGRNALIAPLLVMGALVAAAPAHAAKFDVDDAAGDHKGSKSVDIRSVTGTYDEVEGSAEFTVTTGARFFDTQALLSIFVGTARGGRCDYDDPGAAGTPPYLQLVAASIPGAPQDKGFWSYTDKDLSGEVAISSSETRLTMKVAATDKLARLPLNCIYAVTAAPDNANGEASGALADRVEALAVGVSGTGSAGNPSGTPLRAPIIVVTTEADADRDGIADGRDRCAKVAGARADGCPTLPTNLQLRLGKKRVVVDTLVARTGAACPSRVRVNVTSKGKRIGSGVVVVDTHGSFCRISGVIKLKKTKKSVRVVARGTGMASLGKSVRR